MHGRTRLSFCLPILGFQASLLLMLVGFAQAQGIQSSPYSAPSVLRGAPGAGLDLVPSSLLGLPGSACGGQAGSDSVSLSSSMLQDIMPTIPNLQIGYLYNFGPRVRSGRFTADYLLPFNLSRQSAVFGEAHTEFQSFWNTDSFNNRVDIFLGGGYRTLLRRDTLLGVNGFYDTSRLGDTWYSSGSVGFQLAAIISGNDAIDLNFNWYGQLFNSNVIQNAFRYGPSNFDFQAGYSHELWNGGPDSRLSATGYKFDAGNSVYGWNLQAELKSRDGMFVLRYNVGNDQVNQTYQTIGGFVNVGFYAENVLKAESPFTMPEPIFKSQRNLLYMLTQTVNRNWHKPAAVLITESQVGRLTRTLSLVNLAPNAGTQVPLAPTTVSYADLAPYNTLTIVMTPGPPNTFGGQIALCDLTVVAFTSFKNLTKGQTTVVISRFADPSWFGVGMAGTAFTDGSFTNFGTSGVDWSSNVTYTWSP
jgi:hypothetical protein